MSIYETKLQLGTAQMDKARSCTVRRIYGSILSLPLDFDFGKRTDYLEREKIIIWFLHNFFKNEFFFQLFKSLNYQR